MTDIHSRSFRHGVHPDDFKDTAGSPIERLPFSQQFVLPLSQHLGAPAKSIVRVGERVRRGQLIAEPSGYVSTSIHSPVTGQVKTIAKRRHPVGDLRDAIVIQADPLSTQALAPPVAIDPAAISRDEFIAVVQGAGLVGLGGAAFPSHVKYQPPEGKTARWLVLNGCECEPYLTCDHRVMLERAAEVVRGARILAAFMGVTGIKIGVELNKHDAISALRQATSGDDFIEVLPLRVKYPQGAEKMLVRAVFGQEVPAGKLPIDLGVVVNNVATMAALADAFDRGWPLIERVVTVAGSGIDRPGNFLVPLGTPVRDVLEYCGLRHETRQIVMGGPMMGQPLSTIDVPVLKGTSGLLAFTEAEVEHPTEYSCVRCGRCLDACANFLNPSRLARLARAGMYEQLEESFVSDCMECGACTYACPSGIPIVQLIRVAKVVIRERAKKPKP